jgi:hypothetical protein
MGLWGNAKGELTLALFEGTRFSKKSWWLWKAGKEAIDDVDVNRASARLGAADVRVNQRQ